MQVIAALSEHGPLIVVIEDMHWADRSTRALLLYLMANLTDQTCPSAEYLPRRTVRVTVIHFAFCLTNCNMTAGSGS